MSPFLQGVWLGGGLVLLGFFAGTWYQHKKHVRQILSQGFWPLARGYGDRRAEREVRAQSLAGRNDAVPSPVRTQSRQKKARFRTRRVQSRISK